jgi:hypothetical protein
MMRHYAGVLAIVVLVAFCTTAYTAYTDEQVRHRLAQKIAERWKCSDLQIELYPYSDPAKEGTGWYKYVAIKATDAVHPSGVRMAPISIEVWDVHMSLPQLFQNDKVVVLSKSAERYLMKLSEADLNRAAKLKHDMPIDNVKIDLKDGIIVFTGTYKLLWGHNLYLAGKLQVKDHQKVDFVPIRASVNGIPIPAGPLKVLLNKLNPIIDTADVPLQPRLQDVKVEDGYITLQG